MTKQLLSALPEESSQRERARRLGLYGLIARWDEIKHESWLGTVLDIEETERKHRSLQRRVRNAKIRDFKTMADFDWDWPTRIDRAHIEELLGLGFMDEAANAVLIGPHGVGKTTIAQNLAHQAVLRGYTARFITASELLNDLAAQDSPAALSRRLHRYCTPSLLVIDEVGYLSYDARHGDLLFEVISRRNGNKPVVVTTNKIFSEWNTVFPNSSCVTALIDRLLHKAEIVSIDGESYRVKEAQERAQMKAKARQSSVRGRKQK